MEDHEVKLTDHYTQQNLFGVVLFAPDEVAPLFGVTVETLKNWLRERKVVGVRLGRKWYIPDTAIRKTIQLALQEAGLARTPPSARRRVKATNDHQPAMLPMAIPSEGTDQS